MTSAFRSKKEVVYDLLREAIVQGKYKPGSRLVIDELAVTLGVSQIPIREAMRQLEADGFVTIEPYVGATVTEIDAGFIYEVFALLESLEVIGSRSACQHMSDEELNTLTHMIEDMDSSIETASKWSQENKELHLFICQCGNKSLVLKMMQKVLDHWDRLRSHYLKNVFGYRIPDAQAEHREILKAFNQRDPDLVEQTIRQHNHNALTSYIAYLKSAGLLAEDGII